MTPTNHPEFAQSSPISLEELLEKREARAYRQGQLLAQYGSTLLCLTLNIPGAYKVFPLARRCFQEERETVRLMLEAEKIALLHEEVSEDAAGYTGYMLVAAPPARVKEMTCYMEETHLLGRLFDLDVFEPSGEKLSRKTPPRQCLVCTKSALECGRSHAHDPREVQDAVLRLMKGFFRERLGTIVSGAAFKALMDEVSVTPKPGLVDRGNNGAHQDMDFFTFINSAAAILPYFRECAIAGFESADPPPGLFERLRPGGKAAECLMKRATGGVNTHRGLIFSLAILSAAYGRLYRQTDTPQLDEVLKLCQAMTSRLTDDFSRPQTEGSHGEAVFARHGIQGIRGEAARGFPSVRDFSYPALCRMLSAGHSLNDAGIAAFLTLLAQVEDTNIIYRSDLPTLRRIQGETAAFLRTDPPLEALRNRAEELDRQFIARNISPGGCADLLGITFFLYWLLSPEDISR